MTVVSERYAELRAVGLGHRAAVRELARELDLDQDTVRRVLARAEREARPNEPHRKERTP